MTSLKEMSLQHKSKKELYDLESVDVNMDIKQGEFDDKKGVTRQYYYVEIDGYSYTVKAKMLSALKNVMSVRPSTTKVKFQRTDSGDVVVVPLD